MRAYVETPPDAEPIDPDKAASWLRLDADVAEIENDLIGRLVSAAREYCENYCDRAFAAQQWRVIRDDLAECVLPGGRVGALETFEYRDRDGETRTVDPSVYTLSRDGRLRLNPGQRWPDNQTGPDAVQIVYNVGHTRVPADVIQAMRLLIAHYYENRQAIAMGTIATEIPLGVEALLMRHREMSL